MRLMESGWNRIVACVLLVLSFAVQAQAPDSLLHKPAPQFVRTDLNGQRIDLSSYRGRVVLLTFWATWCAPCQIEMPRFVEWQTRYGPAGLQVIGISMDDDSGPVMALTRKRHVNYPIIMGDERLGAAFGGILGLPVTFLIDREGKIAARLKGETNLAVMRGEMERLLPGRVRIEQYPCGYCSP
jgi:cytochrome c biogenesis protein CcmG, thiol:disulfide interchange protein DsbE